MALQSWFNVIYPRGRLAGRHPAVHAYADLLNDTEGREAHLLATRPFVDQLCVKVIDKPL